MNSVFEKMMSDFARKDALGLLDACMSFDPKTAKKIPARYRIIALGFVAKLSVEEVNEKLLQAGCETLYARNLLEASLMYAFHHHFSYEKWKELLEYCQEAGVFSSERRGYFTGPNIELQELRDYVKANSAEEDHVLYTRKLTRHMEKKLSSLRDDREEFREFLTQNIQAFSTVREKARYYFCKYLCFYIDQKIDYYLMAERTGFGKEQAFSELFVLKGISDIGRRAMSPEEIRETLDRSRLSCGNLYDAFNYFYFDYVSSDWMEVLLDYYGGDITALPAAQKAQLAGSLRIYQPKWKRLGDDEVLQEKWKEIREKEEELDRAYSLDSRGKGYQKNRSGEKSVRNYIRGSLDIDRTTLICYLLFFGHDLELDESRMITRERLDEILRQCRFPELRGQDDFDFFVMQYLQAEDPVDYLMESVTAYAFREQNFFLYHMYRESVSNEAQFRDVLGISDKK